MVEKGSSADRRLGDGLVQSVYDSSDRASVAAVTSWPIPRTRKRMTYGPTEHWSPWIQQTDPPFRRPQWIMLLLVLIVWTVWYATRIRTATAPSPKRLFHHHCEFRPIHHRQWIRRVRIRQVRRDIVSPWWRQTRHN